MTCILNEGTEDEAVLTLHVTESVEQAGADGLVGAEDILEENVGVSQDVTCQERLGGKADDVCAESRDLANSISLVRQ